MTLATDLATLAADRALLHAIIHGLASDSVTTEGGTVPTLARLLTQIGAGLARGAWVTATAYALNDLSINGGIVYRCVVAHTSGTFATDLAANKWVYAVGAGEAITVLALGGATAQKMEDRFALDVSVQDFGAKGDGSTDDTTAFTNALASGKAIRVPKTAAYYKITSRVDSTLDDVAMRVDGRIKFTAASTTTDVFRFTGKNVAIWGTGTIEGNGSYVDTVPGVGTISTLVRFKGANSRIAQVQLLNPITCGCIWESTSQCEAAGVRVVGGPTAYGGTNHYGFIPYLSTNVQLKGCVFMANASGGVTTQCINTVACDDVLVSACVNNGAWEKLLYGSGNRHVVVGNLTYSGLNGGQADQIRCIGVSNKIDSNIIVGGKQGGVTMFNAQDCSANDNLILDIQNHGVSVDHYGGDTSSLSRNQIRGNFIRHKAYTGTQTLMTSVSYTATAVVDFDTVTICDNVCLDADRSGLNRAGVYVWAPTGALCRRATIAGNTIEGCGFEAIELGGVIDSTIEGNQCRRIGVSFAPINVVLADGRCDKLRIQRNLLDAQHSRVNNTWRWLQSGATNEYYLQTAAGANPAVPQPRALLAGGIRLPTGTLGSLPAGSWNWGNNNSLGYNTIYVRLSDDTDPNAKLEGFVQASHADNPVRLASGCARSRVVDNDCPGAAAAVLSTGAGTRNWSRQNVLGEDPPVGTVTLPSGAAFLDVLNDNARTGMRVNLRPENQAAATLNATTKRPFVVSVTDGIGFRVQSTDGTAFGTAVLFSFDLDQ